MNTLKELVDKIYNDLQRSDWVIEYPDLTEKDTVADIIQSIALDIMLSFVDKKELEAFVEASEKNYKEETFKKYITNYSGFLNTVEQEFYKELLIGLSK